MSFLSQTLITIPCKGSVLAARYPIGAEAVSNRIYGSVVIATIVPKDGRAVWQMRDGTFRDEVEMLEGDEIRMAEGEARDHWVDPDALHTSRCFNCGTIIAHGLDRCTKPCERRPETDAEKAMRAELQAYINKVAKVR